MSSIRDDKGTGVGYSNDVMQWKWMYGFPMFEKCPNCFQSPSALNKVKVILTISNALVGDQVWCPHLVSLWTMQSPSPPPEMLKQPGHAFHTTSNIFKHRDSSRTSNLPEVFTLASVLRISERRRRQFWAQICLIGLGALEVFSTIPPITSCTGASNSNDDTIASAHAWKVDTFPHGVMEYEVIAATTKVQLFSN